MIKLNTSLEIPDEIYVFGTIEFNENTPINSINSETNHIDIEKDQQVY